MAITFTCDGCGRPCGAEARRIGIAVVRDYCDECAPRIEEYMTALDDLHRDAAELYRERKDRLVASLGLQLPGVKLPDDGVA